MKDKLVRFRIFIAAAALMLYTTAGWVQQTSSGSWGKKAEMIEANSGLQVAAIAGHFSTRPTAQRCAANRPTLGRLRT